MATSYKRKVLNACPKCVYCGSDATEIDHMPPIGMFPPGARPKGLEFASCSKCNRGSSCVDDIASFLGSISSLETTTEAQERFFSRKLSALVNNYPRVALEMMPTTSLLRQSSMVVDANGASCGALDLRGPLVTHAIGLFGAKFAMALYYRSKGEICPKGTKIVVLWFSNFQALNDEIPQQLFETLKDRFALAQGKKTTYGEFEWGSGATTDGKSTAHWVTIRFAFMYYLFVGPDLSVPNSIGAEHVFAPECLRGIRPLFAGKPA